MKEKRDRLEEFVGNNKNAFEADFDSKPAWEAIEKGIAHKKRKSFHWMAAASVALLLVSGWLLIERYTLSEKINQLEMLTVSGKNYSEIENYYVQTIAVKSELVKERADRIDYPIVQDLEALQKNYAELKNQLIEGVPHQKVVDAMIWNLRTQIEILNEQLQILEEVKNYNQNQKNQENETEI